jgi:integrase/recombinase XerD
MARAKIITDDQQAEILAYMLETGRPLEHLLFYLLLRDTGLRISELICLKFGIFWRDHKIVSELILPGALRKGRDPLDVLIRLSQQTRDFLQRYANRMEEKGRFGACRFLFPGRCDGRLGYVSRSTGARRVRDFLDAALGVAAAKGISAHSFRRTLATLLRRNGEPLEVIQKILGHKNIQTTIGYIEITPEQISRALQEAHRRHAEARNRHHVEGAWRKDFPQGDQLALFAEQVGRPSGQKDVSCSNEEAAKSMDEMVKARKGRTRCKPKPPRRGRPQCRIGDSSE